MNQNIALSHKMLAEISQKIFIKSIFGIGIDLCLVTRLATTNGMSNADRFRKRILSEQELNEYETLDETMRSNFLTKRWAAKEALGKATGQGILLGFNQITIAHEQSGKPFFKLTDKLYDKIKHIAGSNFQTHLSIADEMIENETMIAAIAIVETLNL